MDITTIGFDLAKTVFQVHGADGEGRPVLRRKLRRGKVLAFFAGLPSCLVGMEACASAHYWARELQAHGHKVQLIPPQYVRPFVKTNKNDAADAEAICEAVTRPTMRFAPAKSAEQQSVLMLHRARELLVRQRTMVINALRGHCAEFGLIVAQWASKVEELVAIIEDPGDVRLPPLAREALGSLVEQLRSAQARIKQLEVTLLAWHRSNEASRRPATIPGVGVITATALVATIGDGAQFRSGRQLSAWLGLVPRQHSSGGKDRLGRISKRGDGYIRRLLVHGARFGIVYAVGIERGVVGIVRDVDEIEHLGPPVVGVETPPAGNSLSRLGRVALLPALLKLSGGHRPKPERLAAMRDGVPRHGCSPILYRNRGAVPEVGRRYRSYGHRQCRRPALSAGSTNSRQPAVSIRRDRLRACRYPPRPCKITEMPISWRMATAQ